MSRLRVLMITNMYPSESEPASGVFVKQQVESLEKYANIVEISLLHIHGAGRYGKYLKAMWRVHQQVRQTQCDLIHVHYGLSGLTTWFQFDRPVVVTYYGSDLNIPWQAVISRSVARRAAMNIVVSSELGRKLSVPRSVVIPCGVDISLFKPLEQSVARQKMNLHPLKPYVLFPARRDRTIKNFPLFREAFALARRERPDLEMLELDGKRSYEEISYIMNAMDALVFTSHSEGSPQVIKEAMACNLPIVSVDVGDVRELLHGVSNSYLCSSDPRELARHLLMILEDRRRSDGRRRILESQLDNDSVATRILGVYCQLVTADNLSRSDSCLESR